MRNHAGIQELLQVAVARDPYTSIADSSRFKQHNFATISLSQRQINPLTPVSLITRLNAGENLHQPDDCILACMSGNC